MKSKSTLFYCIIGLVLLSSCKDEQVKTTSTSITTPKQKVSDQDLVSDLYQHYYSNPTTIDQIQQNTIIDYAVGENIGMFRSPTGLFYYIEKEGEGPFLQRQDKVRAHYKGYFFNGKEFDSSHNRGKPIEFKIGTMITGWNEVLTYSKVGTILKVCIPSRLAYGEAGLANSIPPNTPLIFDISVLEKIN